MNESIEVHVEWGGETLRVGTLYYHATSRRERMSFEYARNWLTRPTAFSLDPELPLQVGAFHTQPGHGTFRAFADAAPDRQLRRVGSRRWWPYQSCCEQRLKFSKKVKAMRICGF
ncbi:MAG: HipA N-terminal domain-containing protein [Myxococcota bacterium]